jgi:hypothetical protein
MFRAMPWVLGLASLVACGSSERALEGTAPADAARVTVIDAAGGRFVAEGAGAFRIGLPADGHVALFVERTDGVVAPLVFENGVGSQSDIPVFAGTIDLGALQIVDPAALARGGGDATAESENNPLDSVDSDDEGASDLEDEDDDNDGDDDDSDEDDDGDGDGDGEHDDDDGDGVDDEDETETN